MVLLGVIIKFGGTIISNIGWISLLQMIIWMDWHLANDHPDESASYK